MKLGFAVLSLLATTTSAFVISTPPQNTAGNSALNSYLGDLDTASRVGVADRIAAPTRGGSISPRRQAEGDLRLTQDAWDDLTPVSVQGGSLKTWSFATPAIQRVQVLLKTEGRPLNANVDLWQGPDNTPQKMAIYIEDGALRPFSAIIETPRGQNSIAIRNTAQLEFPLAAAVEADFEYREGGSSAGLLAVTRALEEMAIPETIQGGAIKTYSFDPTVASVQVMLKTDGRPLNARLELLQGPNNNKQVIELYVEDGLERPFFAVLETPGTGNVIRIINTAPVEFPLSARVEPYLVEEFDSRSAVIVSDGGPGGWRGL